MQNNRNNDLILVINGIEISNWYTIMIHPVNGTNTITISTESITNELYPNLQDTLSFPCEGMIAKIYQYGTEHVFHQYSIDKNGRIYFPIYLNGCDISTSLDTENPIRVITKGKDVIEKDVLPDNFWEIIKERLGHQTV